MLGSTLVPFFGFFGKLPQGLSAVPSSPETKGTWGRAGFWTGCINRMCPSGSPVNAEEYSFVFLLVASRIFFLNRLHFAFGNAF